MEFLSVQSNVALTTFKTLNEFIEFVGVLNVQRCKNDFELLCNNYRTTYGLTEEEEISLSKVHVLFVESIKNCHPQLDKH